MTSVTETTGFLKLPGTNVTHIDVERLTEMLRLYEKDRVGFFEQVPRLR
ncbi:MAG TPA: hypothetical protein VK189_03815 [Thermoplasmata archaeon]|nr:hypothetical protein [Thermoplasmata archaeon]